MTLNKFLRSTIFPPACVAGFAFAITLSAAAQTSRWAGKNDATATRMVELEHQWTDADCHHSMIVETLLADDFVGTSPEGKLYSKRDAIRDAKAAKSKARACQTYEVRVHFFGDNVAVLYGSESAILKSADGTEHARKLIWTDTWLKRNGSWQIVAAEDMPVEAR